MEHTEYMTESEVAKLLKISAYSLADLRRKGKGPPYIKIGGQVRYLLELVNIWARSNMK